MLVKYLLLILIALASCSNSNEMKCDLHLPNDICVLNPQHSKEEIEAEINKAIATFSRHYEFNQNLLKYATIEFYNGKGKCSDYNAPCETFLHGFSTRTYAKIFCQPTDKIEYTATGHEVLHIMLLRSNVPANVQDELIKSWGY